MKAIRVYEPGGPEVLCYEDVSVPEPGPAEALVEIEAIGLNFIDIYYRKGLYEGTFPFIPGFEAAGTVKAVGPGVREVEVGGSRRLCVGNRGLCRTGVSPGLEACQAALWCRPSAGRSHLPTGDDSPLSYPFSLSPGIR